MLKKYINFCKKSTKGEKKNVYTSVCDSTKLPKTIKDLIKPQTTIETITNN